VPLPEPPEVLAAEARGILDALGYPAGQRDSTRGFSRDSGYIDHLMAAPRRPDWWTLLARGEPSVIRFWYRESPAYLVPHRTTEFFAGQADLPQSLPGMVGLELDTRGRLRRLDAVPSDGGSSGGPAREPDWSVLFAQARLDPGRFTPVEPRWLPPVFADRLLRPDVPPHPATLLALSGVRESAAEILAVLVNITTHVLFLFVALLLLRFLLRRTWLAVALHWAGYVLLYSSDFGPLAVVPWITLWHFLFFRYGWATILAGTFTADLLLGFPLTSDLSAWHAHATFLAVGACLVLAG
jgi:hypothetical protein